MPPRVTKTINEIVHLGQFPAGHECSWGHDSPPTSHFSACCMGRILTVLFFWTIFLKMFLELLSLNDRDSVSEWSKDLGRFAYGPLERSGLPKLKL